MDEKQEILVQNKEMTAGEMLYNARTTGRRKREIATIAKLLCIREEFLEALESGNYRVIPEDVYILGFARSYAVELGLDPDEVIDKLKQELGIVKQDNEEKESEKKQEIPKRGQKFNKEYFVRIFKQTESYVRKHWILFVGGLVLIVACVVCAVVLITNEPEKTGNQPIQGEVVAPIETQLDNGPDFRFPVREKFNEKSAKESRVVLQAEKESWVKIEDARGNTAFSRVLVPGDVYYMPLGDKFKGTFGNAGGIDVWVDGQLVKKVGPANTRKNGISMAPDALKAAGLAE